MADFTQTSNVLITHDEQANPITVIGAAIACATWLSGQVYLWYAPIEVAAATAIKFIIQGSGETSGNNWADLIEFLVVHDATVPTEAMTATEPIAETSMACASTTGFAAGDWIYIRDTTTDTDGEWHRIQEVVSNTSIELIDGLEVQKDSSDVMWGYAEVFTVLLDLEGIQRVRVLVVNEVAGPNFAFKADLIAATDIA